MKNNKGFIHAPKYSVKAILLTMKRRINPRHFGAGFTPLNKTKGFNLSIRANYLTGFTLIELLVIIAIIGLLSAIAVTALNEVRTKARDAKRVYDLTQIRKALQFYYDDYGQYPPAHVARNSVDNPTDWVPGLAAYMPVLPIDPINKAPSFPFVPFIDGNYTYYYSSFGPPITTAIPPNFQEYNLFAQLETNHPLRCEKQCWEFNSGQNSFFMGQSICGVPPSGLCGGGFSQSIMLYSDH